MEHKIDPTKNIYIGYTPRLILFIILVPILSILGIYLFYKAFEVDDLLNIRYQELGTIEEKILDKEKKETTEKSKIDTIDLDFSYDFTINEESNLSFKTKIVGDLYIVDNNNNTVYEDTFDLREEQTEELNGEYKYTIKDQVTIPLNDYLLQVEKYRTSYGMDTIGYLKVYEEVSYKTLPMNTYYLDDASETSILIPLTEDAMIIKKDELDTEKRVNKKPTVHLESPGLLGIAVIISILAIFSLTQVITLIYSTLDQKSIYDKVVDRLLKKYKNKIIVVTKQPYMKGKKKVNVNNFKELLKVYKRIKTPIKYCSISDHNKCQFYIEENKMVYSYIIKAVDLEKKD